MQRMKKSTLLLDVQSGGRRNCSIHISGVNEMENEKQSPPANKDTLFS